MDNKFHTQYTATRPTTAATTANAPSRALMRLAAGATPARGASPGAPAGREACGEAGAAVAGRGPEGTPGSEVGGLGGASGPLAAGDPAADAAADVDGGPPGSVGNLIVAAGLGGRLMRTVSFFGCTLAASDGLGGTAPGGGLGSFSAIILVHFLERRIERCGCQTLIQKQYGPEQTTVSARRKHDQFVSGARGARRDLPGNRHRSGADDPPWAGQY